MSESYLDIVKRFAKALDLAIHDRDLARSHEGLIFLIDADVAIDVIVGLTAWDPANADPEVSDWSYVVRALISTGYVPKLHFLLPHLVEFDRFIGRIPKPYGQDSKFRRANLKALAEHWGLSQYDHELADSPDSVEALAEFVKAEGFEVFVKLELCYGGTAYDRLLRICRHIDMSELSSHIPLSPGDPLAHSLAERVSRRDYKPINARVDGYALAELARRVDAGMPVRFYTHTDALTALANLYEFKDQSGRTVFRDQDYFIMRCSFPALRFPDLISKKRGTSLAHTTSLDQFREIRDILFEIVDGNGGEELGPDAKEISRTLEHSHDHLRIGEIIDDFKRLKFLGEVFLRWELPKPMASFIPYLKAKLDQRELVEETRRALGESLEEISAELDKSVGHLRDWKEDYVQIRKAIRKVRNEWEERPDPWRDLGLGRWGLEATLPPEVKERLQSWIEAVYSDEASEQRVSDFALMIATKDYASEKDLSLALCVLWALKLYKSIVHEWEEIEDEWRDKVTPGLYVLYLVAQTKSIHKPVGRPAEFVMKKIDESVSQAQRFAKKLAETAEPLNTAIGEMGLAHVTYWAWNRAQELRRPTDARKLAEKSYDAGLRAAELLEEGSLMWGFAINHAAYLGVRTDLHKDKTEELLRELGKINEEHYHYRIADTRARAFTEQVNKMIARYTLSTLTTDEKLEHIRRGACDNVRAARNLLDGGGAWFGDLEVKRHRELLDDHWRALECSMIPPG